MAAEAGNIEAVDTLIGRKCDVSQRDKVSGNKTVACCIYNPGPAGSRLNESCEGSNPPGVRCGGI